jgi:hypothetical protein
MGQWQRVAVIALLVIPLLLLLALSAPGWLAFPFLPPDRQNSMLELVRLALDWIKTAVRAK